MIFRQADTTSGIPVGRIMPVLPIAASADQEQNFRAGQFSKGQEYFAQVVSKADKNAFNVNVSGTLLRMNLGNAAQTGQTLHLRYIEDSPVPTFLLLQQNADVEEPAVSLSPAANMLGAYLKEAGQDGVPTRLESAQVITQTPQNAQLTAQGLKQAIQMSGLFYESHLADFIKGQQSMAAIRQEPQNQALNQVQSPQQSELKNQAEAGNHAELANETLKPQPVAPAALLAQQLAMLENQQLAWHGEVWPGQAMDWSIRREDQKDETGHKQNTGTGSDELDARAISSQLTLHLPKLGSVTASLQLENGHVRISILADAPQAVVAIRQQLPALALAMASTGLGLDALSVNKA